MLVLKKKKSLTNQFSILIVEINKHQKSLEKEIQVAWVDLNVARYIQPKKNRITRAYLQT